MESVTDVMRSDTYRTNGGTGHSNKHPIDLSNFSKDNNCTKELEVFFLENIIHEAFLLTPVKTQFDYGKFKPVSLSPSQLRRRHQLALNGLEMRISVFCA